MKVRRNMKILQAQKRFGLPISVVALPRKISCKENSAEQRPGQVKRLGGVSLPQIESMGAPTTR